MNRNKINEIKETIDKLKVEIKLQHLRLKIKKKKSK